MTLRWVESYIKSRKQAVCQVSLLGPLLYTVYLYAIGYGVYIKHSPFHTKTRSKTVASVIPSLSHGLSKKLLQNRDYASPRIRI